MDIWKLHALGNNFVFVRHDPARDHPALAHILCRRETSVGGDGLLSLDLTGTPPMVRMWNPDGTPDFCGNGLCCAAYLARWLGHAGPTMLDTPTTPVPVEVADVDGCSARVTIAIPHPEFDPAAIPLSVGHAQVRDRGVDIRIADRMLRVVPANNGNMHTVVFVDDLPGDDAFTRDGPLIENHPLFPERTNVLWCAVGADGIDMRVWERGVGETFSCGTGAAAAVAVSARAGIALPANVPVRMRGGTAHVRLDDDAVRLSTIATLVFEGRLVQTV